MAVELPCPVLIYFGRPIEPRRATYPRNLPQYVDPPLDVDELPGWLDAWRHEPAGWLGQVWYRYPVHGFGLGLRFVDWLPEERLRLPQ